MFNFGPWELIIILAIVLVIFGGRRIPQLAKDLGSGIREFRKTMSGASDEVNQAKNEVLSMHQEERTEPVRELPAPAEMRTPRAKKSSKKAARKKSSSR